MNSTLHVRPFRSAWSLALAAAMFAAGPAAIGQVSRTPPSPLPGLQYESEFFPGSKHDAAVPSPDSILGRRVGDAPAAHSQVEAVVRTLAEKSPRCRLFEYGRSHEGRALYYLVISSEENIANLEAIKEQSRTLADPRGAAAGEVDAIARKMPAIAWMSYVIHGDEGSGTDAALALAWHLAASTDESVKSLLRDVVVLIDPLMNPDGRDRYINLIRENRTAAPSVDDQSILHAQVWPTGRMNHYLFDMNRDWIFATQPETRGRIRAINEWNPHYFMESHEQGSQDTFLFMPPREPVNPNLSGHVRQWENKFAIDQAKAFDERGWRYYTGEWNEGWYPGYSGSWAAMRGIVDNLYEQAAIGTDAVRRADGTLEAYREAVHKQLVSSLANLETLRANRLALLAGYVADRRANVDPAGQGAVRKVYAVTPRAGNAARFKAFLELLKLQGIEIYAAGSDFAANSKDWLGREHKGQGFAKGTWLIPSAQPLAGLVRAMFDLDPRMSKEFLTEERRELLRVGQSRLYDITGWNVAMLYGLEIWELESGMPEGSAVVTAVGAGGEVKPVEASTVAYVASGNDDASVTFAAHLLERGLTARVLDKATELEGVSIPRGSVFVFHKDNPRLGADLHTVVGQVAGEVGVEVQPVRSGLGPGDAPDLGGQHLVLLHTPRIGVLTRDPFNPYTAGEIWHQIDQELGIRASYLAAESAAGMDLRRYNVLVLPDGGGEVATKMMDSLRAWVEAGGTLIAIGSSAEAFAKEHGGIGSTRLVGDVLTKREEYRISIIRDWLGRHWTADDSVWSSTVGSIEYPWVVEGESPSEEEAKRRDAWRSIFMPQGAILAGRTDDRSWLTMGTGDVLPVLYSSSTVLVPSSGMLAPVLFGAIVPAEAAAPVATPIAAPVAAPGGTSGAEPGTPAEGA
ncbi:MAG TPA: M14 family metallopeptidase, partial [Phycisphaerales bacterium]|nr:M14 family metallopeptidase [Phycisphaerales bacterium]